MFDKRVQVSGFRCQQSNHFFPIRNPQSKIQNRSKSRGRPTFAEDHFTGRIFGNMLLELFAPQTLKCATAAVQGVRPGKIGGFTAQIAEF